MSDAPQAYKKADGSWEDGADLIRDVPVSWDETRVIAGDIGEYIVTARRKGDAWYIGAMTNEAGRTIEVPLSFLGEGQYDAAIWQDGSTPTTLERSAQTVTRDATISLQLAPSGGATIKIAPKAKALKKKR